jgi:hypothetical protein
VADITVALLRGLVAVQGGMCEDAVAHRGAEGGLTDVRRATGIGVIERNMEGSKLSLARQEHEKHRLLELQNKRSPTTATSCRPTSTTLPSTPSTTTSVSPAPASPESSPPPRKPRTETQTATPEAHRHHRDHRQRGDPR